MKYLSCVLAAVAFTTVCGCSDEQPGTAPTPLGGSDSPPVVFFNPNVQSVVVTVNNSFNSFTLAGASEPTWAPQATTTGGPGWSNTAPAPNVLGPGTNFLTIAPQNGQPFVLSLDLPGNIQWRSVQLYLFFDSSATVSWNVLNGGQYVTGATTRGRLLGGSTATS